MPGLLDFANTDDGMQGLGLLAAAAPQMAPQNLAGRLAQAAQSYQGMKSDQLKQQDLAQQIQLKNIALQQQQQEFALQLPLLQEVARRMGVGSQAQSQGQAPSQPQGQSQDASAQGQSIDAQGQPMQMQGQPQPQQGGGMGQPVRSGGSMFPGIPDNIALPTAAFGGMKALVPLMTKYNEPTDLMKLMSAAGIDQNSLLGKQMLQQAIAKSNYQAPTRLGEGAYASAEGGIQGLPTAAPKGFINVRGNDGTWSTQQVAGGLNAVEAAGTAEARGPATLTPEKVFNDKTNKFEYQTKANIADAANGVPQGKVTEAGIRKFADINSINIAPPTLNDLAQVNAALSKPGNNALQTQLFTQERDRIVSALHNPQQTQTSQSPQVPQAASGAYSAEPSLGTTANADAAQKASAQTMHTSFDQLSAANKTAPAALDSIDRLMDLAKQKSVFSGGPLAPYTAGVNQYAAKAEKERANLIIMLANQNGTNGSDAGRNLTGDSVPDYGKPVPAQLSGLQALRNQIVRGQLKTQFLTTKYTDATSKDYVDSETNFDKNISPNLIPLLTMPSNKSRALLLKSARQDPEMNEKLEWAAKNGLFK